MSTIQRSSGLTRLLLFTAVGLVPVGLSCTYTRCLAQDYGGGQDPGGLEMPYLGPFPGDFDQTPRRGLRTKTAKKGQPAKKADSTGKAKTADSKKDSAGSSSSQVFTRYCANTRRELHRVPQWRQGRCSTR